MNQRAPLSPSLLRRCALASTLALAACAHGPEPELKPAAGADRVTMDPGAAQATVGGVSAVVDGDAWSGLPRELDEVVPVHVSIENQSGRPLRVQYGQFSLVGPQGSELAALPPLKIEGTEIATARVLVPESWGVGGAGVGYTFVHEGFAFAQPYDTFFGVGQPWVGPFAFDPLYYNHQYARWPVELPTASMVVSAIPEGVLRHGGKASGFLFFQDVPEGMERVTFTVELVDAETGERFGELQIPFRPVGA